MTPAATGVDPFVLQQTGIRASQLVGSFGLTRDDWDDLRQDMLLDYLTRSRRYEPARGDHRGFVFGIVRNRAARLSTQQGRRAFVIREIDDEDVEFGAYMEPSVPSGVELLELRLDVRRVVASLPEHLRELAMLLGRMSVADVRRATGRSRPRIYQMIGEIRQAFEEAGLAPCGGAR